MDENDTLRLATIGVGIKADDALARVARVERLLLMLALVLLATLLLIRRGGGGWWRDGDDGPEPAPAPVEEVEHSGRS